MCNSWKWSHIIHGTDIQSLPNTNIVSIVQLNWIWKIYMTDLSTFYQLIHEAARNSQGIDNDYNWKIRIRHTKRRPRVTLLANELLISIWMWLWPIYRLLFSYIHKDYCWRWTFSCDSFNFYALFINENAYFRTASAVTASEDYMPLLGAFPHVQFRELHSALPWITHVRPNPELVKTCKTTQNQKTFNYQDHFEMVKYRYGSTSGYSIGNRFKNNQSTFLYYRSTTSNHSIRTY